MPEDQDQAMRWARVAAKAWGDEDYKKRLPEDPAAVLAEGGVEVPEGVKLVMRENTADILYMTLPLPPASGDVADLDAREVAVSCCSVP